MPSSSSSDAQIFYSIVTMTVIFLTSMIFESIQKNKNKKEFIKESLRANTEKSKEE